MSRKALGVSRSEVIRLATQKRRFARIAQLGIFKGVVVCVGIPRQNLKVEEVTPDGRLRVAGRSTPLCPLPVWGVE